MIWGIALLALMAFGIAWPWLGELLRKPVRTLDAAAPGAFADLSQGRVHYRWSGDPAGPLIVLVHGLTTPLFVWDELEKPLTVRGFRLLSYDLFGRGFSDRPRAVQDAGFFLRQLEELLTDQRVEGAFTLIGYSMGGAIATAYAAKHPSRAERLILLAPAGMGHALGAAERLVRLPGVLAEWLMLLRFPRGFRAGVEAERGKPGVPIPVVDGQLAQLERRGYLRSVLASLRGILAEDREADHRAIAAAGLPVLAIWGQGDETIPIAAKAVLEGWNPTARHVVLPDGDHALAYTHADEIAALL